MASDNRMPNPTDCAVERRGNDVVVRVRSRPANGKPLPDAVFTFRAGDPQYAFWSEQLLAREAAAP